MNRPRIARSPLCQRIVDHSVRAVYATEPEREPFFHIQIKDFFPHDVYERMLELLPDPQH